MSTTAGPADLQRGVPPVIWGSVPRRNKNFTGRDALLDDLRRRMIGETGEVTALLPHALQGLGGVGKTQLAVEYVYRYAVDHDVVWWIPADQPVLVRSTLAALAPRLGLTNIAPERVEDAVRAVVDSLRRGDPYSRWLLIFDNADEPDDVHELMPNGPGDVLITSRNYRWQNTVDTVEVDVFTRAESLQFLKRRVPGSDDEASNRLAEELGDLPLALEQAGALQAETGMSVAEYLGLLDTEARKLLAEDAPSGYPWPVAAAWSVSVARVRERMPFALELLRRCAFFGPEPIPRELLQRGRYVLASPLREKLGDPIMVSRAIRELGRYALVKVDSNRRTLQVHRLIQKLLRDELIDEQVATIRHEVHLLLAAADPGDPELIDNWPKCQELLAHVGPSTIAECAAPDVRMLTRNVLRYLYEIGDYTTCRSEIDRALAQWQANLPEGDLEVMELLGQKAWVLWALGQYARASEIRRANLEQARELLGRDHEYSLYTTSGYGADLRARGEFAAALRLDEELLERHRRVFGADDRNTFMMANNLAVDYCLNGQYELARRLDEQSYRDRLDLFGRDDHPSVLVSLGAIARDLRLAGEYAEAVRVGGRTHQGFEVVTKRGDFPESHLWVLQQSKEYSIALRKFGRIQIALELAQEVYRKYRKAYGPDHPDTLSAAISIGNALRLADDLGEASRWIEDAVRRYGDTLGADHPFTIGCALNLAIVRRFDGRPGVANELLELALSGLQRVLGLDHHYTIVCLAGLATAKTELGDVEAARKFGETALKQFKTLLGDEHPHTLACSANLALDLRSLGARSEAEALALQARERLLHKLGEGHPDVQTMRRGERLMFDFDPPPV